MLPSGRDRMLPQPLDDSGSLHACAWAFAISDLIDSVLKAGPEWGVEQRVGKMQCKSTLTIIQRKAPSLHHPAVEHTVNTVEIDGQTVA
ncbi:unnamed protein product [Schistocephalus solidus]|uniref:Transcriptional regulator n=1 Tax=Schistocephalus solidus TaxID=70667 RepID=A0A183TCR1_SCHSO|nr:unnamed protein product [Schistocephalus solidus]